MRKPPPPTPSTDTSSHRQNETLPDTSDKEDVEVQPDEEQPSPADLVRAELAARGITEQDVADAIKWARSFGDDDE